TEVATQQVWSEAHEVGDVDRRIELEAALLLGGVCVSEQECPRTEHAVSNPEEPRDEAGGGRQLIRRGAEYLAREGCGDAHRGANAQTGQRDPGHAPAAVTRADEEDAAWHDGDYIGAPMPRAPRLRDLAG